MLHIDELKDLCTVPLRFKKFRADSVCQERGHSFFEDSIFENRFEKFVLDLVVQLMLAARHGKDDLCPPLNRLGKCIIGCLVTGMKCHDHIHLRNAVIICDVPLQEMQFLITIFLRESAAFLNYICLEIQTDDVDIITLKSLR